MPNYSDPTLTIASSGSILPSRITVGQILVLLSGVAALLVAGYMYYQVVTVTAQASSENAQDASIKTQIGTLEPAVAQLTNYNAIGTGLKQLFDTQKLWSPSLANLEAHLYRHMVITNLQIDTKGQTTLSGTTANYTNYAQVYSSLNDPSVAQYFTNVKPVSVSKDPVTGIVSFNFTFTFAQPQFVSASAQQ